MVVRSADIQLSAVLPVDEFLTPISYLLNLLYANCWACLRSVRAVYCMHNLVCAQCIVGGGRGFVQSKTSLEKREEDEEDGLGGIGG